MKKHYENLNRFFKDLILVFLLKIKKFNFEDSILIFSEARGGSTWLMQILNKILLNTCINWEPLHVKKGIVPSNYNFGWRPFIPKNESNSKYYILFSKIHTFSISNKWTRQYLSIAELIKSKYVITKYVRGNLILPYILENFNFKYKPILLIRHPIDICISQIKTFKSNSNTGNFSVPNCINNEIYTSHIDYLNKLNTDIELKIAIWCIENCSTLNQIDHNRLTLIYYSDLLIDPEKEIKKLILDSNLHSIANNVKYYNYREASKTDFESDYISDPNKQLHKNIDKLDIIEKDNIQKIFNYFNFKLFNAYSPYPIKE